MLRMTTIVSAEGAKSYFREALSRGEYYADEKVLDQEVVGEWGGLAAERFGLSGLVTRDAFESLCDNRIPQTGEPLTPRTKDQRRVGYDLTWSVPKSVSLAMDLGGDRRIAEAFRESVRETMRELEADAETRVRRGGADHNRPTSNLLWAEFTHFTARPVGGIPDPQAHVHCVVFNATWDQEESRWKAADLGRIKTDAPYFQAAQQARLKEKLVGLGYDVERRGGGWEIAGIPEAAIRAFSRRTDEIEKLAKERGITNAEQKAELGAQTRQHKLAVASMEDLRQAWRERLPGEIREQLEHTSDTAKDQPTDRDRPVELDTAFRSATEHLLARQSTVTERALLAATMERSTGGMTPESARAHLEARVAEGEVLRGSIDGTAMVTTPRVLEEERAMLETVREGRGRFDPLAKHHECQDTELSEEQQLAVRHVLESTDGVVAIRGRAGVGKTRLMQEVVSAIEALGLRVQPAAPTAMATHEVLRGDGFDTAQTVASVLQNTDLQHRLKGQVVWVDEAGLLSTPDMAKLVRMADRLDARLLLTGDTAQHSSVARGDAMRLLEVHGGITPAEVRTVRRQQHEAYREACSRLNAGDLERGFAALKDMGAIREVGDDTRATELAGTYLDTVTSGRTALVVSPTHGEGRAVTDQIRERLRDEKLIGQRDSVIEQLRPRQLTEAEKADATVYRPGDVVEFHQNIPGGTRRSDRVMVTGVSARTVTATRQRDSQEITLPLKLAKRFEVYEKRSLGITRGDQVRITKNGRTHDGKHRLNNGTIYGVTGLTRDGKIKLTNGWTLPKGFGHIAHGYCVTSFGSQGRTIDHLILAQSSDSAGAADKKQFYTSVTRGRKAVTVFTDDANRLLKSVSRDRSRVSATELVGGPPPPLTPPLPDRQLSHSQNQQRSLALFASVRRGTKIRAALNARIERVRSRRRARSRQRQGPGQGLSRGR
ncbi:MAG: relaxase domain-containing protein [Phycisphaera sp.]|nr:MAG: relaxase domain-containing protein [Phycisphaera sp.]